MTSKKINQLIPFILLFFSCHPQSLDLPLKITFIDVGQGDCILIQTPNDHNDTNDIYRGLIILIDGGEKEMGETVVVPFLRRLNIDTIDLLIATHAHSDHMAGLIPVIQEFPVKMITQPGFSRETKFYQEFATVAKKEPNCQYYERMIPDLIQKEGDLLNWGKELEVTVLNSNAKVTEATINNSSVVLRIAYGKVSILLMGDAEGKNRNEPPTTIKFVEKSLLDKFGTELKSDILKVSHHGSETSTTIPFLNVVKPKFAIITAGNKKFGQPALPDLTVIQRLKQNGIKIFRTDYDDQNRPWLETLNDDHIQIILKQDSIVKIGYLTQGVNSFQNLAKLCFLTPSRFPLNFNRARSKKQAI